mmetsp:Transcript_109907/g.310668  ORF Transcript_109907/g.310668 Transcript_109907/m.310668 type:complete len:359 (+) Transcript_109907:883-1959(+)
MSVPALIIFGIISSLQEAGPRLATTFVFRLLSSISCGLFPSSTQKSSYTCGIMKRFVVSASSTASASAFTASRGNLPLAASPLSITASVPSHTAFCRSAISARVGTGASIMLSTICVAVMTKSPAALAFAMSSFCAKGTLFTPSSTPRSPRATISAWDFSMMPSMLVSACGFSIFGQILGLFSLGTFSLSMMSMSSCRSWPFCAKETQMYSQGGSSLSRYSASSMSFSVRAAQSISQSGTFTPLRAFSLPPRVTWTLSSVSEIFSVTLTSMRPSSISSAVPAWHALMRAFCSIVGFMVMRPGLMLSLSSLQSPNSKISPSTSGTGSPASSATRNLGPCRSPRTSTFLPSSLAYLRIKG